MQMKEYKEVPQDAPQDDTVVRQPQSTGGVPANGAGKYPVPISIYISMYIPRTFYGQFPTHRWDLLIWARLCVGRMQKIRVFAHYNSSGDINSVTLKNKHDFINTLFLK